VRLGISRATISPDKFAGKKIDQASANVTTSVSNTPDKAGDVIFKQSKNAGQMIK